MTLSLAEILIHKLTVNVEVHATPSLSGGEPIITAMEVYTGMYVCLVFHTRYTQTAVYLHEAK